MDASHTHPGQKYPDKPDFIAKVPFFDWYSLNIFITLEALVKILQMDLINIDQESSKNFLKF